MSWARSLAGLCLLWLASCAATPTPAAPVARSADGLRYTFAFDRELRTLRARLCFDQRPPAELVCGVSWGREFLRDVALERPGGELRALPVERDRIQLRGVWRGSCVRYAVDVGAVSDVHGALRAERRGDALMSNLTLWLWRPPRGTPFAGASARFELPEGMQVSVPWRRSGDAYILEESAFRYLAYGVVGSYQRELLSVAGAEVEVAVLDGLPAATRARVAPWIESASLIAALPGGRFPRPSSLVVVVPDGPGDAPVGFGHVVRGGGTSVGIFLRSNARLEALKADWVAVHEFSHLWHPFVEREDAWLSEGLATYYQEVLRARAGVTSAQHAWRRLWEGSLLRSEASASLARESAEMFENRSFRRVYWGGAAFALMADVELRRRSGGRQTLDGVMTELAACCSEASEPLPAGAVIAEMDRIAGSGVFGELYARWVLGPALPDLRPLYAALGVEVEAHAVREDATAPDAWIRDALMRRDHALARRIASGS